MPLVKTSDALEYFEQRLKEWEAEFIIQDEKLKFLQREYESSFWFKIFKTPFEESWEYRTLRARLIRYDFWQAENEVNALKGGVNACLYNISMNYDVMEWDTKTFDIFKFYNWVQQCHK